jgi:hypothetical protein
MGKPHRNLMARTSKPFRIVVAATGEVLSTAIPTFVDFETAHRQMYHLEQDLKRIGHNVLLAVAKFD